MLSIQRAVFQLYLGHEQVTKYLHLIFFEIHKRGF